MKLTGWMNSNIVGAPSIGMLCSGAAAQDKVQKDRWQRPSKHTEVES